MSWWAIDVRTPADRRAMLGAWLVARTGQAVEERDAQWRSRGTQDVGQHRVIVAPGGRGCFSAAVSLGGL